MSDLKAITTYFTPLGIQLLEAHFGRGELAWFIRAMCEIEMGLPPGSLQPELPGAHIRTDKQRQVLSEKFKQQWAAYRAKDKETSNDS